MVNELLIPAGDLKSLKVAIDSGADAVYCAGQRFGARSFIKNLTNEEIIEGAHYAHLYGKKIYITLNTLIFEDELESVEEYIDFLYQYVDAVIVQDYGIVHYIRNKYPDFPIHLSTQTSIHNINDIRFLKRLGISRIVLAREVSIDEIREFNKEGIELEIFIHGALCFSYSGLCYLSYYKGGRSGNRGNCAQPCRMNYSLLEDGKPIEDGPLLSMKDLNTSNKIKSILNLGVASLKIEGRAKSAEYVMSVTKFYRSLIDNFVNGNNTIVDNDLAKNLYSSFSREKTEGYIFNSKNCSLTTDSSVKHLGIPIGKVISYQNKQAKIKLFDILEIGDGIRIVYDNKEVGLTVTRIIQNGKLIKKGKGAVIIDLKQYVIEGSIVYKTQSIQVKNDVKYLINSQKLHGFIEIIIKQNNQILNIQIDDIIVSKNLSLNLEKSKTISQENIINQFTKTNNLPICYDNINYQNDDNLYMPIKEINYLRMSVLNELENKLENRLIRNNLPYPFKTNLFIKKQPYQKLVLNAEDNLINNSKIIKQSNLSFHLSEISSHSHISPYLGATNHYSIDFFRNITDGVIVLSFESTLENSLLLTNFDSSLGYLTKFKEPLMISKHCVVAKAKQFENKKCGMCFKHHYDLKDENNIYSLKFNNCIMQIEGKEINRECPSTLISVELK